MAGNHLVGKTRDNKDFAYEKDPFIVQHRDKILALAKNPKKLNEYPTKSTPQITYKMVKVSFPRNMVNVQRITIDDIDSFSRVKRVRSDEKRVTMYEKEVKALFSGVLGEKGKFQDWGGETGDLYSTRMKLYGKRKAAVFGLKGKGTTGKLTPKKMGKNGDQIARLFRSPADVFLVQYNGQIDPSVIEQMEAFATAKSVSEKETVYHGVIDGQDTHRLFLAYPTKNRTRYHSQR